MFVNLVGKIKPFRPEVRVFGQVGALEEGRRREHFVEGFRTIPDLDNFAVGPQRLRTLAANGS